MHEKSPTDNLAAGGNVVVDIDFITDGFPDTYNCLASHQFTLADPPMLEFFICHATEDKELVARPIAQNLSHRGLKVWFDEFSLSLGDSLRRTIDKGLAKCDFAIVVVSPAFFEKQWPQRELDGLTARELDEKRKLILPIWHMVTPKQVREFSPPLADKLAVSTEKGVSAVCESIVAASKQHSEFLAMDHERRALYADYYRYVYDAGYDDGHSVSPDYTNEIEMCVARIKDIEQKLAPFISPSEMFSG